MTKSASFGLIYLLCCSLSATSACSAADTARLYQTEPRAPSLNETSIAKLEHLGTTLIDQGANFSLYSANATRIELLLFDDPERSEPTRRIPLTRFGDVWNIYVQGVGVGQHYGYAAWGPNWPFDEKWFPGSIHGFIADVDKDGNRFNPNKLLSDPYARALHRDHDWSKGSTATGPARAESTWAAATKSVIVKSEYVWSANETSWRKNRQDASWAAARNTARIIYEVHAKGFTADAASGVTHPGTFRGVGEKADYFKQLGITAVELMPVQEKPLDGGYWGYMTLNFFSPELSYASARERNQVIDEFKWMVDQLHQRDIEVLLDVVYNHSGEGGLWREKLEQDDFQVDPATGVKLANFDPKEVAGLYNFRGIDNASYYALSADNQTYWNNTGVGNETRCNNRPMRRLIIDSLRYWVEELHVDGYRFDLAPVLGAKDLDPNTWLDPKDSVLQEIVDDPILKRYNVPLIAEPWSIAHFKLGAFPKASEGDRAWGEWNANFRDVWRSFFNTDDRALNQKEGAVDIAGALTGSYDLFNHNGRRPYHSVNFITAHDGFTGYDLFSYNEKKNGCGVLNPRCCDQRLSPFCDRQSGEDYNRSRDLGENNEHLKRQMLRNMFAVLMLSHGTPMMLGGDEWMRTQFGNNNAYSSGADNHWNWFAWGTWQPNTDRQRMVDFVSQLTALRKANLHAFSPSAYDGGAPFAWKNAQNSDMTDGDWSKRQLMQHYWDQNAGPELLLLINMETDWVDFTLPEQRSWQRLLDTQSFFDLEENFAASADKKRSQNISLEQPVAVPEAKYRVAPFSIVLLRAAP
ncbi:MAG: glycosyl hydrolase [Deltaproteobacteria bacterium]|nr:glycosyl hydrolase [Deltaproteobacteria bacterium]